MSLRTRLILSFTVLLLVVIAAVGLVASRSIEGILVDQVDRVLIGFGERGPTPHEFNGPGPSPADEGGAEDEEFLRTIAELWVDSEGQVLFSRPSGFSDDPDPLPDVSDLPDTREPFFLSAVDDSLEYRATAVVLSEGIPEGLAAPEDLTLVRAAPLTDVAAATQSLIQTLVLAGIGVLLVGGAATWWTVERSMKPVEQMVDTAEAIASGDLSRRVPDLQPGTELSRLGNSLNEMLAHIEESVATEREGRERLRRFIADASHELRTPLTAISGYAELRRKGGLAAPGAEDRAWSRIESEGHRMGSLIEDLIMLTRLGQSQPLRLGEVDVALVVRNAAADHRVVDPGRPIMVTAPESVVLQVDEERLHQVLISILNNARMHTPVGTSIVVSVADEADRVVIEVADDGPGFPEAALSHVFDRFYRADPSRSRHSGGSGLGLSIVEAIVTAHGGTAEASNVEGGGARITITLPRSPAAS
jgi:two-component system OmpR family sensor kinase